MSTRYAKSEAQLARARKVIPLGAQTFSKSITQYPLGVSPYFAARARGSRVWDVDGNEYTDYINALAAITLGHADPDVNEAVSRQLADGTVFTLSHTLESDVAERICAMVPSAEMVRFGKNGSDATAGAIRIARAFTGRDHVLMCGYHGWLDWSIGTTARNKGVPAATRALTHTFPYNDLAALEAKLLALKGQVAAIILEPMNVAEPLPGYLAGVKALAEREGAVLVFDETITGFRFADGGAQELFGVTPHLATFGKGLANGFPLSAVAGRRDIMMEMEEVFFSFTMGGECLSLAAARACLDKMARERVTAHLARLGTRLKAGVAERIQRHGAAHIFSVSGHPSWTFLNFSDANGVSAFETKTLFMQEMFERGILAFGTHNLSFAHDDADIDALLAVYDAVLPLLATAVNERRVRQLLKCAPLEPLFKVR